MIKKTFQEIRGFNMVLENLMNTMPDLEQTKIGYAMKRVLEKDVKSIIEDFNKELSNLKFSTLGELYLNNALTDPKTGAILYDETGKYLFNKDGMYIIKTKEQEFTNEIYPSLLDTWDKKVFNIQGFFVTEIPKEITEYQFDTLKGFVFAEDQEYKYFEKVDDLLTNNSI